MRKDSGFEVMDHINIYVSDNDRVATIAEKNKDSIKRETLGIELVIGKTPENAKEWDINGEKVMLAVEKV